MDEKDDRPFWLRAWDDVDFEKDIVNWLAEKRKIHGPDFGRTTRPRRRVPLADGYVHKEVLPEL